MTVDMKMLHGPQNPGLLILFADASLWGRLGAHPRLSVQSSLSYRVDCFPAALGRGWFSHGALGKSIIDRSSLSSHMRFLSWASHTFLVTMATVRHPSMGIMPGFGVWNSASCPWLTLGSRGWYLVTLNSEVWENKHPKKKGLSSGSELRFVELSGLLLNEHRFKSWLCHLLVVRSKHRSDRQHTRTLLGEVLAWVMSACGASLTVSRGEERQRFAWKSLLRSLRNVGASKWAVRGAPAF